MANASFESLAAELREKHRVAKEKICGAKCLHQNSKLQGQEGGGGGSDGDKSPVVTLIESDHGSREDDFLEGLQGHVLHDPAQC